MGVTVLKSVVTIGYGHNMVLLIGCHSLTGLNLLMVSFGTIVFSWKIQIHVHLHACGFMLDSISAQILLHESSPFAFMFSFHIVSG